MKILLTGSSGFLGGIIKKRLSGRDIITLGRHSSNSIIADICTEIPSIPKVDLIIHSAGKAHSIPKTKIEEEEFFKVNVAGTINLLNSLSTDCIPKSFVFISTVAVYGLLTGLSINEDSTLLATDPYGLSKIEAERVIEDWCLKNDVILTVFRLPLVAGPNPPGNLRAMIAGIKNGYYFDIGGGNARKSIVMAQDVADIIPKASLIGGTYNLTDRCNPRFSDLSSLISAQLGKSKPTNVPLWIANIMAMFGDLLGSKAPINTVKLRKIISDLTFDDSKAFHKLAWRPRSILDAFKIK